jgi:hypothetical protein
VASPYSAPAVIESATANPNVSWMEGLPASKAIAASSSAETRKGADRARSNFRLLDASSL